MIKFFYLILFQRIKMFKVAVLPGDGIGVEIIKVAVPVVEAAAIKCGLKISFEEALIGGAAYESCGHPLPATTLKICDQSHAIFLGAVGGPKYDKIKNPDLRPERGALLPLRKRYGLYANLRPAKVFKNLEDRSNLKASVIKGMDMLVVRELTGGAYFGQKKLTAQKAWDKIEYTRSEITRILNFAFGIARQRRKRLTLVHKANVLMSSVLWKKIALNMAKRYPDVKLDECYVDAFTMYLLRWPASFDVVVTENMMGDIITDEAAEVTGSIGLLPSASLGEKKTKYGQFGLYEPSHGSAPDIAGKNIANPVATILSGAMLLRYSCSSPQAAIKIEKAVLQTLTQKIFTKDLAAKNDSWVSTEKMGLEILKRIK
jgi:3-isopropylmalate dehydrogenase